MLDSKPPQRTTSGDTETQNKNNHFLHVATLYAAYDSSPVVTASPPATGSHPVPAPMPSNVSLPKMEESEPTPYPAKTISVALSVSLFAYTMVAGFASGTAEGVVIGVTSAGVVASAAPPIALMGEFAFTTATNRTLKIPGITS